MLRRGIIFSAILILLSCSLFAQRTERKDSLVRLLGCDKLQQVDENGNSFRQALGNARFEHNATLLLCDTALWNVNENVIKAIGHVKIIQNRTVLSSDKLDYLIDQNVAQFRGSVVQLQDKDKNTLRTRYLDYNTKDSVATFTRGGAFKDKDGQLIESTEGTYDSKIKTFNFFGSVNMFTDSVFVKTRSLDYNTETGVAVFTNNTHAWRDDNMLSSDSGWYDRKSEIFTFTSNVHIMTDTQEAWSDSLIYNRLTEDAEMFGNVELLDTSRQVAAVAGYMQYIDSLQYIRMARDPAVIVVSEEKAGKDTVYVGGDEIVYWTVPKCDIPENEITAAETRLKDINVDPITEYRVKAAEEAKAAAEAALKQLLEEDPNAAAALGRRTGGGLALQVPDSLALAAPDSLAVADSLSNQPKDTTRIGFLRCLHNVRVFKRDMQVACDSLVYNDLDSLVRLYKNPVVWNEVNRQYSSDSISVVIKNRSIEKASLMSNAFIAFQEDSLFFDQIKGAEMMAYFDSTGGLQRFDSMGGASGVFFLEENGALATVNKFEAKMLTATFRDGNLYDLNYFEEVKSDAYPVVQLKKDERVLKGFDWQPEKRPTGPEDVTSYIPRESEREKYLKISQPVFQYTDEYFPGYLEQLDKDLKAAREKKRERQAEQKRLEEERKALEAMQASLEDNGEEDNGEPAEGAQSDTLAVPAPLDSLKAASPSERADTIELNAEQIDSLLSGKSIEALKAAIPADPKAELKAKQKAEREAKQAEREKIRQERASRKEAKWAALDAKDAEKAAKKEAKRQEKQRIKMEKMLKARAKREAKEQKILEGYKAKFEKQKARKEEKSLK